MNLENLNIVHLDDNVYELEKVKKSLADNVKEFKYTLESFLDPQKFYEHIQNKNINIDVALLDVDLENDKWNGIQLIKEVKNIHKNSIVIILSQQDDIRTILSALQNGADDFISKKSEGGEFAFRMISAIKLTHLKRGVNSESPISGNFITQRELPKIAGDTMQEIVKRMPRIINSAIRSVYVYGESGTGKEIVADILAAFLPKDIPFVKVNCGAISESLLESELFGHVKGAFTGAMHDKVGLIEKASGGWIFLDEVATLTKSAQVALLRAIENQEIIKVGSNTATKINVRFISASNENLEELVKQGRFRQDLFQRLCETEIYLPPLRERSHEIKPLVKIFCDSMEGGPYKISQAALNILCSLSWKEGNVRQLRNCLRAMTEFHVNKTLIPASIPQKFLNELNQNLQNKNNTTASSNALISSHYSYNENQTLIINFKNKTYSTICDEILINLIKWYVNVEKIFSLRGLAKSIGISRNTLQQKILFFINNNLLNSQDIEPILNKMDKSELIFNSKEKKEE